MQHFGTTRRLWGVSGVVGVEEQRVVAKDPPGFEEWVTAHADGLTRFAALVLGNTAAADDAVQEALSRAYPRWARIATADDPLRYVRRMVVNAHVSWWRRVGRHEVVTDAPRDDHADPAPADGDDRLWQHCLALPLRQRAAVVLRFYEGLSYAEVAQVLGVSDVTARTQTHRALRTLRAALEEEQP